MEEWIEESKELKRKEIATCGFNTLIFIEHYNRFFNMLDDIMNKLNKGQKLSGYEKEIIDNEFHILKNLYYKMRDSCGISEFVEFPKKPTIYTPNDVSYLKDKLKKFKDEYVYGSLYIISKR